jgi:hypothetical protein
MASHLGETNLAKEWARLERIVANLIARYGEQSVRDVLRQCEEHLVEDPKTWQDWLASFAYIGLLEAYCRVLAKPN